MNELQLGIPPAAIRVIDLTIPLQHGMDAFPGEPTASYTPFSSIDDGGIEMWNVTLFSQLGTHVDAPSHFVKGATPVDRLDLTKGIGPATVIDVPLGIPLDGSLVRAHAADLRRTTRALFRTGHSRTLGTDSYWKGFPEFETSAVDALVELGIVFVGIDTPTPSMTRLHEIHHRLLGSEVLLAECLVNVEALSTETYLVCLPLPLVGLDGSPARIVALEAPSPIPTGTS